MPDEKFDTTLLRLAVASVYALVSIQTGREMFGKGSFALTQVEKTSADQVAYGMVLANFQVLTEESLKKSLGTPAQAPAVGFVPASAGPKQS
jgi:hypothetical protein